MPRGTLRIPIGYLMVIPAIVWAGFTLIFPGFLTLFLSFTRWRGYGEILPTFSGLENYYRFGWDPVFIRASVNTLLYSGIVTAGQVLLGLILAALLHTQVRGWKIFRSIFFFPVLLTSAVTAVLWSYIYNPIIGLLPNFLRTIGLGSLAFGYLGRPETALFAMMLKDIWQGSGFAMIILLAAFTSVPEAIYDSARIDGASPFQTFRRISLPLIRNVVAVLIALQIMGNLKVFDTIWVMTGGTGGPGSSTFSLATYAYYIVFGLSGVTLEFGYGSAIALVLLVVVFIVSLVYLRYIRLGELKL